jgi:hypothetical protein
MKKLFIILAAALCFCAGNKATSQNVASGTTGSCTWALTRTSDNYALTISGTDAMVNYTYSNIISLHSNPKIFFV